MACPSNVPSSAQGTTTEARSRSGALRRLPSAVCHPSFEATPRRNQGGCSPPLSWVTLGLAEPRQVPSHVALRRRWEGVRGLPLPRPHEETAGVEKSGAASPGADADGTGMRGVYPGQRLDGPGFGHPSLVRLRRMGGDLDRRRMQSLCNDACAPEHVANFPRRDHSRRAHPVGLDRPFGSAAATHKSLIPPRHALVCCVRCTEAHKNMSFALQALHARRCLPVQVQAWETPGRMALHSARRMPSPLRTHDGTRYQIGGD